MTDYSLPKAIPDSKGIPLTAPTDAAKEGLINRLKELHFYVPKSDDGVYLHRQSKRVSDSERRSGRNFAYTGGQSITFNIPKQNRSISPVDIFFDFRCALSAVSTSVSLGRNGSIQNVIRRLRVRDGHGQILEDIDNYNVAYNMHMQTSVDVEYANSVLKAEGYDVSNPAHTDNEVGEVPNQHHRDFNNANGGNNVPKGASHTFKPFVSGFFNCKKMIPLWATNGLYIEFILESNDVVLFDNGANVLDDGIFYKVFDTYCYYTQTHLNPSIQHALEKQYISPEGLPITYKTVFVTQLSINNYSTHKNYTVNENFGMLHSLDVAFTKNKDFDTPFLQHNYFKFHLNVEELDKFAVEFNEALIPEWGLSDNQSPGVQMYESRKNSSLLRLDAKRYDQQMHTKLVFDDFTKYAEKTGPVRVINFESFPGARFTGIDTANFPLKVHIFPQIDVINHTMWIVLHYSKKIILKDATSTLVES
jgi:hypothetical protein